MRLTFRDGELLREAEVAPLGEQRYRVTVDGTAMEVRLERRGDALEVAGPDGTVRAWVTRQGAFRFVTVAGVADARLERVEGRRPAGSDDHPPEIASPMPGRVVKVLVAVGDEVKKGQPLIVVEAMKTELALAAPRDGRVARIDAEAGRQCEAGKPLIELVEL